MRRYVVLAVLLFLCQQVVLLGIRWVDDETWYSIPAKTLVTEGRARIPVFNDTSRNFFPLPPLLSMLEAVSWRLRSMTIVQARALTLGFGAGMILATYFLARRLFDDRVGAWAAALCAVENMLFLAGRTVRPEILVAFFTVAAMALLLKAVQDGTTWPLVLAGLSVGAGMSSHPNGAAASLCGVVLLWFFEGWRFLRNSRLYAFAACCTLGILPMVLYFVANDSASGYAGFRSLLNIHSSGGATMLERFGNSAIAEISERYVGFAAFPYRVHLVVLSLAAVIVGLIKCNRATRFLAGCVLVHLLFFTFVIKANKTPRYMALVMPFVSILWADWIVTLWTKRDWSGVWGRWLVRPAWAKATAGMLCIVLILSQLLGNAGYLWKYRQADTNAVCREIDALIPPNSTVYGAMAFWIGLQDHTYVPYMRMPWPQAIDEFHPNIAILDDWVMVKGSYPGEWDALRAELHEYVDRHGKLLGTVPNAFYGDLQIYEVTHP